MSTLTEKGLLDLLGEEVAAKFIANTKPGKLKRILASQLPQDNYFQIILGVFVWDATPEGHEYWSSIAGNL